MQIFSHEFKNYLKRNLICRFAGHRMSDWMTECWALGHQTGHDIKICKRCKAKLRKRKSRNMEMLHSQYIKGIGE